ncbi:hypothetical protein C7M84_005151 [Penaeus vannamei]|uniref:UV-stimulated scaffold protein A C-terminal domain-containing protein n=1 Tax=Penaeus vannamei TaxID=6689 RepID=A0A3R7M903_PENVA|nr:hypothetical protein C7M84_005151 [Penaeus vannamei]
MQRFVSANNPKGPPGQQSNTRAAMAMLQTSRIHRRVLPVGGCDLRRGFLFISVGNKEISLQLKMFPERNEDQHAYQLRKSVEDLTTSGKDKLDEETFKKVKKICKKSDFYVIELYKLLCKHLKKNHAEIRYSAFQICDEIFRRSHCFRELLLKDFKTFADLTLGLDPKKPLPKPKAVAQKLKQKCVETIQQWYDSYSHDDQDGQEPGGFFFEEDAESPQEGGFIPDESREEKEFEYGSDLMRGHGIMKGTSVQINLGDVRKVQETRDNEIVIQNLKENVSVLKTKYVPLVKRWEQTMRPHSEGNGALIKRILDIKNVVEGSVRKFESVQIIPQKLQKPVSNEDFDSDSDDDFIEVPFDDPRVISAAASEAALLGISGPSHQSGSQKSVDPDNQPSTSGVNFNAEISLKQLSKKEGVKKVDARCPDEYLSKETMKPQRHHNPLAGLSQVWTATPDLHEQDEMETTGGILGIATQRVNYERTWEPVKWECRAPLATGRLCPRRDRERCPLHGPIIPRDEIGQPVRPEDVARERAAKEKYEQENPAWQDPQLLAEIKAATGVDLKVPKGRSRIREKYKNLTDIKKTTPRERLAKKVLSKRAVRRLNSALARDHSAPQNSSSFNFG